MKILLILIGLWSLSSINTQDSTYQSKVYVADQGDGTYCNPILHADYSDPDVCAIGNDFYMTASSFNCVPGLPILQSKDLVNWRIVNYALQEILPSDVYAIPQHGKGVWAPCIRYHDGLFYIYWGDPDFGIYMVYTKNPKEKWSKPILVKKGKGLIDATPLWDNNGKVYLAYALAGSRIGINSIILVCEMNAEGTQTISDPVMVFDGNDGVNHTVEGPKFYKRNDYYYIMAPAGGVTNGWQLAMRSKNIYGPYESKIVMAQGKSNINGPHQGAWVETTTGESWFVHFQDKGLYGRVTHLNPMKWVDNWPIIGQDKDNNGYGEPVSRYKKPNVGEQYNKETPAESDEFNTTGLGLQWSYHANPKEGFGYTSKMGFMRLYGHTLSSSDANLWEIPNLLLQKFPAESFTATTKVHFTSKEIGVRGGLIVMGFDYAQLIVERSGNDFEIKLLTCTDADKGNREEMRYSIPITASNSYEAGLFPNIGLEIYLRVIVKPGGKCLFSYSLDNKRYHTISYTFTAREGRWIGAKLGLVATNPTTTQNRGWLDIDWFRITK